MHRPLAKFADEKYRHQIQQAVDKPAYAKFGFAILAGAMFNYLLPYLYKPGPFGYYRDVAMHFAINLDVFDYGFAVGFQSAVKVMQVVYPAHTAGSGVINFSRNSFAERVVPFGLPARYQVV